MANFKDEEFTKFCVQQSPALRRIARATRNEYDLADVTHSAWVLAEELKDRNGTSIRFMDASYQQLLLSHLYQQLVRYSDKKVRTAARLEHSTSNGQDDLPSLSEMLADRDGEHALTTLINQEEWSAEQTEAEVPDTAIKGYVRLLARFHTMRAVANHLLISVSYAYRCKAYVLRTTKIQQPVPTRMMEDNFLPGPWRRRRYERVPIQHAFEFDDELPFNVC